MENRNQQIEQIKEDMQMEWWKAGPIDNFNLKNKLDRVGCRPLRRKFLSCKASSESMEEFADCKKIREEMEECYKTLHYI